MRRYILASRLTADQYDSAHDSFPTHLDINYLPQKPSPHGGTWEAARIAVVTPMTAKGGPNLWHSFLGNRLGDSKALANGRTLSMSELIP